MKREGLSTFLILSRRDTVLGGLLLGTIMGLVGLSATHRWAVGDILSLPHNSSVVGLVMALASMVFAGHQLLLAAGAWARLPTDHDLELLTESETERALANSNRILLFDAIGEAVLFHFVLGFPHCLPLPTPVGLGPVTFHAIIKIGMRSHWKLFLPGHPVHFYIANRIVICLLNAAATFGDVVYRTGDWWLALSALPTTLAVYALFSLVFCWVSAATQRKIALQGYKNSGLRLPWPLSVSADWLASNLARIGSYERLRGLHVTRRLLSRRPAFSRTHGVAATSCIIWTLFLSQYTNINGLKLSFYYILAVMYAVALMFVWGLDDQIDSNDEEASLRADALHRLETACATLHAQSPTDLGRSLSSLIQSLFPSAMFSSMVLYDTDHDGPAPLVQLTLLGGPVMAAATAAEAEALQSRMLGLLASSDCSAREATGCLTIVDSALGTKHRSHRGGGGEFFCDWVFLASELGAERIVTIPLATHYESFGALIIPFGPQATVHHRDLQATAHAVSQAVLNMRSYRYREAEAAVLRDLVPAHLVPILARTLGEAQILTPGAGSSSHHAQPHYRKSSQSQLAARKSNPSLSGAGSGLGASQADQGPYRSHFRSQARANSMFSSPSAPSATSGTGPAAPSLPSVSHDVMATIEEHQECTILWADCIGYTAMASEMDPLDLMVLLHRMYSAVDSKAEELGIWKLDTQGDAYVAVCGINTSAKDPNHALAVLKLAVALHKAADEISQEAGGKKLRFRVGISTGPAVSGVIGKVRRKYVARGPAVTDAESLEARCLVSPAGRIATPGHVCSTAAAVSNHLVLISDRTLDLTGLKRNAPGLTERLTRVRGALARVYLLDTDRIAEAATFSGIGLDCDWSHRSATPPPPLSSCVINSRQASEAAPPPETFKRLKPLSQLPQPSIELHHAVTTVLAPSRPPIIFKSGSVPKSAAKIPIEDPWVTAKARAEQSESQGAFGAAGDSGSSPEPGSDTPPDPTTPSPPVRRITRSSCGGQERDKGAERNREGRGHQRASVDVSRAALYGAGSNHSSLLLHA